MFIIKLVRYKISGYKYQCGAMVAKRNRNPTFGSSVLCICYFQRQGKLIIFYMDAFDFFVNKKIIPQIFRF